MFERGSPLSALVSAYNILVAEEAKKINDAETTSSSSTEGEGEAAKVRQGSIFAPTGVVAIKATDKPKNPVVEVKKPPTDYEMFQQHHLKVVANHVKRLLGASSDACEAAGAIFVADRNWSPRRPFNYLSECLAENASSVTRLSLCETKVMVMMLPTNNQTNEQRTS